MFANQDELLAWIRQTSKLWLFLDYDGTLAEFTDTPGVIEQNPAVLHSLGRLIRENTDFRITILSGRKLADIKRLIPFDQIYLAGTYGIEIKIGSDDMISRADFNQVRPVLERLKPRWEVLITNEKGFYLEDKGWSLALHARFASEESAQRMLDKARNMASEELTTGIFRLFGGERFFEIAPRNANKGKTVSYFLENFPWQDFRLVYCGDDDKDEEAFQVVHNLGGATIWVAHSGSTYRPSLADLVLDSPRAMRDLLDLI